MTDDLSKPDQELANFGELLDLPDHLQALVRWLRQQSAVTLTEITAQMGDASTAAEALEALLERGLLERLPPTEGITAQRYRLRLQGRRTALKRPDIWQTLVEDEHE